MISSLLYKVLSQGVLYCLLKYIEVIPQGISYTSHGRLTLYNSHDKATEVIGVGTAGALGACAPAIVKAATPSY